MKKWLIISVLLLLSFQVSSQDTAKYNGGMGFAHFGMLVSDAGNFSQALSANGLPSFSGNYFCGGGTGLAIINNILFGGEGMGGNQKSNNADYASSLSFGYGGFVGGYNFNIKNNFNLFPLVTIGAGGVTYRLEKLKTSQNVNVNNPLTLSNLLELKKSHPVIGFSLGTRFDLDNFLIGCRIGYLYAFSQSGWEMNGGNVENFPDYNLSGFHFSLIIGGVSR
jgi:hypothetical protein